MKFWHRALLGFMLALVGCHGLNLPAPGPSDDDLPDFQAIKTTPVIPESQRTTEVVPYSIEESVPDSLAAAARLPANWEKSINSNLSQYTFGQVKPNQAISNWVYILVSPFPQVLDDVSQTDLISAWLGEREIESFKNRTIFVDEKTRTVLTALWGNPGRQVQTTSQDGLYQKAFENHYGFAIIPFEDLQPYWKLITLDGKTPLDKRFETGSYPLMVHFGFIGSTPETGMAIDIPKSNLDLQKLTILTMTGTTAMVRALGENMEKDGVTYPAEGGISGWFRDSDFVHVSNEVSFSTGCPPAKKNNVGLQFCSRPEYIGLLDSIHANIIELSGNHIMDWGAPAFKDTLALYRQHQMMAYAGGVNQTEASRPLKIEHNGNKIALIGCNQAGPEIVWAGDNKSGTARCDFTQIKQEIKVLSEEGYSPIVTIQYEEGYDIAPTPQQRRDFDGLAEAGAVIVSGSQAHSPQAIQILGNHFIHYGLGNLFFDMMRNPNGIGTQFDLGGEKPVPGARIGVIDRHIFYNGKYIQTELYADILEGYAQLRPLTSEEKRLFLTRLFEESGW